MVDVIRGSGKALSTIMVGWVAPLVALSTASSSTSVNDETISKSIKPFLKWKHELDKECLTLSWLECDVMVPSNGGKVVKNPNVKSAVSLRRAYAEEKLIVIILW